VVTQAALIPVDFSEVEGIDQVVEHGEIFTRRWVVELILDLAGYTSDKDLASLSAVEPACGTGAFVGPIVERLSASMKAHTRSLVDAADALRAYDLLDRNVQSSRAIISQILRADGWDEDESARFAEKVVVRGDYLLRESEDLADFVLGNPPYIRLEEVPAARSGAYRRACPTMRGRADIYVGFLDAALRSLRPEGKLAFIVADRWMHNDYGAALRELVASNFSVDVTIKMHDVNAFEEQVAAYPAVSVLRRGSQQQAVVADTTKAFGPADASKLTAWVRRKS
jgi:adenine-specific DNA-methyltransferase